MNTGGLSIAPGAIVCVDTVISGPVTIGTVVHPQCQIIAERGPIIIGQNNIISESARIINRRPETMLIGDFNVLEARSPQVLEGTSVGNQCVVAPTCSTIENDKLADFSVIYGDTNCRQTQKSDQKAQMTLHIKHLKYLHDTLPRYNHVRKPES
ncbi:hypothetical protein H4R33_001141 [Dimargaris cristalligena]|uniref:Dynactin subunit 6 n=1 Tax=Dimargaris cristalligena TaxID=215637 RepID=A0A4P9ZTJ9_9FUNG|nr:hypothetical protein H4R33_001141 [Dimargaris cristalligena]RKP35860.1 hypothetical protein BJ085DRAFT_16200 [Dimargaris cristalligena]|eukprot:RKP35860.1 hypothetical protein BJ085DRAFT_16200 [Dimargaris cristalligena]